MLRPLRMTRPRRIAFVALVAAVVALHAIVTRDLASRLDARLGGADAMPQRIEVAYVRTIEPEAPPAAAPVVVPTASPPAPRAPRPLRAASAPVVPAERADVPPLPTPTDAMADASPTAVAADVAAPAPPDRMAEPTPGVAGDVVASDAPSPAVDPASPATADGAKPFAWPPSTRVSYVLNGHYRGAVSGHAQVEWIKQADGRYQVNLDLVVGPEFAPIISRRMTSEGHVSSAGLVPERYDEDTQVVFRDPRRLKVVFEADEVVLANGKRQVRLPGVQDTASQFVQLTYLFTTQPERLRAGATVEMPLALPRGVDTWTYDVLAGQTLTTPFGDVEAFHLKPRRAVKKFGELTAEVWIAPELRYLPVRIRIEQNAENYIDLMIEKKPEMAAS